MKTGSTLKRRTPLSAKSRLKAKRKRKKPEAIGTMRRRCDRLMQETGRKLYPFSILSGKPTEVMHHFVPKSVCARLRYEWDNLIPLTNAEHMRLHQSGDPWYEMRIVEIKGEAWWKRLQALKGEMIRVNKGYYAEVEAKLKALQG